MSTDDEKGAIMADHTTPILELRNITKRFGPEGHGILAVDDCTVKVQKGEFICVVGPSGCGKSTLMTVAAGLDKPTRGEVLVEGKPAGPPGPKRSVVLPSPSMPNCAGRRRMWSANWRRFLPPAGHRHRP